MTLFDRLDSTTVGQRIWIALGFLWLFVYCLFVMLLVLGMQPIFVAMLTALIVMGFPTAVVVFLTLIVMWIVKGVRKTEAPG